MATPMFSLAPVISRTGNDNGDRKQVESLLQESQKPYRLKKGQ